LRELRALAEDGLELLGEIDLGSSVGIGDPGLLGVEGGAVRAAVQPGSWLVLGRAWELDRDELSEVVAVHRSAIGAFYAHYDALVPLGESALLRGRVAFLDAGAARDPDLLVSLLEPDELPWILAAGFVAGEGPGGPARVLVDADPAAMVLVALGRPPAERAPAPEIAVDSDQPS
jgi:hypothetical protein